MKHTLRTLAAVALVALMAACGKDDDSTATPTTPPEIPTTMASLENTSWEGTFIDKLQHQGTQQMLFHWTLDFNADGKGIVVMEVTSPVIEDILEEFEMDYSYDGSNKGKLEYTGELYHYTSEFEVNALNHSLDVNLWMHFNTSEADTAGTPFGGRTTLYQTRK